MEIELNKFLVEGIKTFGISLNEQQVDGFAKYMELLKEWNEKINLTAIEEDREIIIKHFVDSVSIAPYVDRKSAKIIDVGTGAGFPGIPLKIIFSDINVSLLDSLEKRIRFLNEVIENLKLDKIYSYHGRAEDFGLNPEFREKYDVATARAVAALPVLSEYCLPFVKVGGLFIAMKGSSTEEINDSAKALDILGGKIEDIVEFVLPFSDMRRNIILIRKFRQTPTRYPRKAGKPSKEPLI